MSHALGPPNTLQGTILGAHTDRICFGMVVIWVHVLSSQPHCKFDEQRKYVSYSIVISKVFCVWELLSEKICEQTRN